MMRQDRHRRCRSSACAVPVSPTRTVRLMIEPSVGDITSVRSSRHCGESPSPPPARSSAARWAVTVGLRLGDHAAEMIISASVRRSSSLALSSSARGALLVRPGRRAAAGSGRRRYARRSTPRAPPLRCRARPAPPRSAPWLSAISALLLVDHELERLGSIVTSLSPTLTSWLSTTWTRDDAAGHLRRDGDQIGAHIGIVGVGDEAGEDLVAHEQDARSRRG